MGHAHNHTAGDAAVPRRTRRRLTAVAVLLGLVTLAGMAILWPRHNVRGDVEKLGLIKHVHEAVVVRVTEGPCRGTQASQRVDCKDVRFRLTQGPNKGEYRTIEFALSRTTPDLHPGDKVVLNHVEHAQKGYDYTYADRQRRPVLMWLAIIFAVVVIALGRLRGVGALVGLGGSIAVILGFMLPSMLDGNSPPLVAIIGASAVAYLALYVAYGFRTMTTVALLSTLAALALTVGLATLFTHLAHFSGASNEDTLLIGLGTSAVDIKGLVLAGMVLGALGALNDITVTQASAVGELRLADASLSRLQLYRAGIRIGRDHIASTVNTLALAYAGASLPLLILFTLSGQSLGAVANGEIVAIEIVATLVGSIGLVTAVPISTWFAALVATEHSHEHRPAQPVGARSQPVLAETSGTTHRGVGRPRPRGRARREPEPPEDLLAPRDEDEFWR
ncbi:MAG TPA: YibE/F family protein [Acidimicrobiia bacterium]|nr:YibE/F family protein [Acidimicrobiia bacterium]